MKGRYEANVLFCYKYISPFVLDNISRFNNFLVCSESEERRLNCAAQRKGCLPAADEEPARCYGLDHHYAGIGRR